MQVGNLLLSYANYPGHKPKSRTRRLEEVGGAWMARLQSPPVDGKANRELLQLVAEHFQVPSTRVTIKSAAGVRIKRVQIRN